MRYIALLLLFYTGHCWSDNTLRIAVAANFKTTLEHISTRFQQQTGLQVSLSSASTGVLYSQILHGAPFHLFFAADKDSAMQLEARGLGAAGQAFCYAHGKLVLSGGDVGLSSLANPEHSLAIANPTTAPYGRAAMEVLSRPEFAGATNRKLVRGSNAIQAYQFWYSAAVDLALVPQSLLPGRGTAIPADWHLPIEQYAIVLKRGIEHSTTSRFLSWLGSDSVRQLIIDAGYTPCP